MRFLALAVAAALPLLVLAAPAPTATASDAGLADNGADYADDASYVTVTLTTTVYETATPSPRPDAEACTSLAISCVGDDLKLKPGGLLATVFHKLSCVMAFPCRAVVKSQTSDELLAEMFGDLARYPPTSYNEPRLSKNIFAQHSSDNATWSQEDFVNTYYGKLNGTYYGDLPPQSAVVEYWNNLLAWTGFCASGKIPYQNLADWYQYSSTVPGAVNSC